MLSLYLLFNSSENASGLLILLFLHFISRCLPCLQFILPILKLKLICFPGWWRWWSDNQHRAGRNLDWGARQLGNHVAAQTRRLLQLLDVVHCCVQEGLLGSRLLHRRCSGLANRGTRKVLTEVRLLKTELLA